MSEHKVTLSWSRGDAPFEYQKYPRNLTVLPHAYSDSKTGRSGEREPMLMALSFGKGRVFHTTLGHDVSALSSVDFAATFQRGTEWAATGGVTQRVPADFPTADAVSVRADLAAMDPGPTPPLSSSRSIIRTSAPCTTPSMRTLKKKT